MRTPTDTSASARRTRRRSATSAAGRSSSRRSRSTRRRGPLVISWRDARNDAANARVATYITTSIDGGNTFSPQTYANPSQTAIDAITGQTDVLGPEADNQSADNRSDGHHVRLRRPDGAGRLRWPGLSGLGRQLQSELRCSTGTVIASPLNIWYRPMVIAAGPRIINSTMGPITLAEAASGSVSISVTFDRPITASTFVAGDVEVFYHDTTNDLDRSVSLAGDQQSAPTRATLDTPSSRSPSTPCQPAQTRQPTTTPAPTAI